MATASRFNFYLLFYCSACNVLGQIVPGFTCLEQSSHNRSSLPSLSYITIIGLSLVAFQLWGVLEQLAPEIFLNYFFKTGDLSMVQLTQNMQKISKKWKKRQKCIDITLRKWSWRPLWQVGKKSINRFHRPPVALFEGPHLPLSFFVADIFSSLLVWFN